MAQDPSGLTQGYGKLVNTVKGWLGEKQSLNNKPVPKPDTSWHDQQVRAANDSFRKAAQKAPAPAPKGGPAKPVAKPSSFKKGGVVQKTGYAKVHKGEKVLTKAQQAKSKKGK